jgi:hypothetical protein
MDNDDLYVMKDDVIHCEGTKKLGFRNIRNENASIYVTLFKVSADSAGMNKSC